MVIVDQLVWVGDTSGEVAAKNATKLDVKKLSIFWKKKPGDE